MNLYGFLANDPNDDIDYLGCVAFDEWLRGACEDQLREKKKAFEKARDAARERVRKAKDAVARATARNQVKRFSNRVKVIGRALGKRVSLPLTFFLDGVRQEMDPYGVRSGGGGMF